MNAGSTERWGRVKQLTADALERPESERLSWLAQACAGDEGLRREVSSLLQAHADAGEFLETPGLAQAGAAEAVAAAALPGSTGSLAGRSIGPYRVTRELGHGGMGVVYLAERADAAFEKKVAIKVVRGGFASGSSTTQRFHEERRILAALDHPNIARLLDAGTLEDGLPYLVMEYVDGTPLDVHCEGNRLSVPQRLQLFRQVCAAVQFAHQRLVIHRDLKARNILVTADGIPKLLDFGIAKLLEPGSAPEQETRTALRALTLEAASPEQVRGEPMTVASDVYALGVLLYRLLSGQSPYGPRELAENDLIRAICEQAPARPSLTAPLERRRELRGELDWIVLKALRKEPERRYASVEQFAEDLDRHLSARPVSAAPDSWRYRAGRFLSRHRTAVAAAGLLVLSLVAGLTATLWQNREARRQRARAERRFADVRTLANSFLFEFHDAIAKLPGTTKARELVVRRALEYLDGLAAEPESDDALRAELASAYEKVGDVQGLPYVPSLGDTAGARRSFERAYALQASLVRKQPGDAERLAAACRAGARLGSVLLAQSEVRTAAARVREFLPLCEEAWRRRPDLGAAPEAFRARIMVGDFNRRIGDLGAARAFYRGVIVQAGTRAADDPSVRVFEAQANDRMSQVAELVGDIAEALPFRRRQIEIAERVARDEPANAYYRRFVGVGQANLALLLGAAGEYPAALAAAARAADIYAALLREDPDDARAALDVARIHVTLGRLMLRAGRLQDAHKAFREARTRAERACRLNPASTEACGTAADALADLGTTEMQKGRLEEAVALLQQALELKQKDRALDPESPETLHSMAAWHRSLGRARSRMGALAEGCRSYARAVEMFRDLKRRAVPPVPSAAQIDALVREQAACNRRSSGP